MPCCGVPSTALPQMVADIRKYVQHISLSPDSIQNDEVSALPAGGLWGARGRAGAEGAACRLWPHS